MATSTLELPVIGRAASISAATANEEDRTVEVVWSTGARRTVTPWFDDPYDEELSVSGNSVRLGRLNAGAPLLNSHRAMDVGDIIGVIVEGSATIEGGVGRARVRFSSRPEVDGIWHDVRSGIIRNLSVGYLVHEYRVEKRSGERDLWTALDWEPVEISAVPVPADPAAQIAARDEAGRGARRFPCIVTRADASPAASAATIKETTMADEPKVAGAEAAGQNSNPSKDGATTAPRETDDKGRERPAGTPEGAPPLTDKQRAALIAEERQRSAAIMGLCARAGMGDRAEAYIERGAGLDEVRAELLDTLTARSDSYGRRQEQVPASPRGTGERAEQFRGAVTDAILHRMDARHQLPDAAREFRGLRIAEIAKLCLERAGQDARGMFPQEAITAALQARSGVGYHSTSDFPLIVSGVMNRTLRQAYEEAPRTFTAWARRTTLRDFRPVTRAIGWGAPELLKVNEGAEFQYGTVSGTGETLVLATYGRVIAFTRQLLVNDDMDALGRMPQKFGSAAADLEGDIVYGVLLANPTMSDGTALFHASHGNLGAASVINDASLAAAMLAFATMKNDDGRTIRIAPRYLIVPPGPREMEARRVLTQITPGRSADVNVYANSGLEIVVEPRLIPASGQHPWFLAADPARVDTIDYAFLEGQEGVFTETRAGFEVDGVEIKARHDFGAGAMDWHGLYKNPGAAPV